MRKYLIIVFLLSLICGGCAQNTPQNSEYDPPFDQTEKLDPDVTEKPTDETEPSLLKYHWEQISGWLDLTWDDVGGYGGGDPWLKKAFVFRSLDDLKASEYQTWEFVDDYDNAFFETNTLIVVNCLRSPPVGHRVIDLVGEENGSYLLTIERLTLGGFHDISFGTTLLIEVDQLVERDALIEIEVVETIVSVEELPHDDVFGWQ